MNKRETVLKYIEDNPKAKVKDIAAATNVNISYVYYIIKSLKKKQKAKKDVSVDVVRAKKTAEDLELQYRNDVSMMRQDIQQLEDELDRAGMIISYLEQRLMFALLDGKTMQ